MSVGGTSARHLENTLVPACAWRNSNLEMAAVDRAFDQLVLARRRDASHRKDVVEQSKDYRSRLALTSPVSGQQLHVSHVLNVATRQGQVQPFGWHKTIKKIANLV